MAKDGPKTGIDKIRGGGVQALPVEGSKKLRRELPRI